MNETFGHFIGVFTLEIGPVVFPAPIEGFARAGKAFAQIVIEGETMDRNVVRMIRGVLSPRVSSYTMEVKQKSLEGKEHSMGSKIAKTGERSLDSCTSKIRGTYKRAINRKVPCYLARM